MVSKFKPFKRKIYRNGLEINFFVPPKNSSPSWTYIIIPIAPQKAIFFKIEKQLFFSILHTILAFITETQAFSLDEKKLK